MSAVALLADLSSAGVRLSRNGNRLRVEAPRGTITPKLKQALIEHQADLLATLPREDDTLGRLCVVANLEGVDTGLILSLPVDDLEACDGLPTETLCAYVRALRDSDLRRRGTPSADETSVAVCRRCGPVWVHPCIASVAPVLNGLPQLLGCPWCHVRDRASISHPPMRDWRPE